MNLPLLSIVVWLPLLGGLILLCLPSEKKREHGIVAMVTTLVTLAASLPLFFGFNPWISQATAALGATHLAQFKFAEHVAWIPQLGINYVLGVDGIGLLMVIMTTAIFPFAVGASLKPVQERTKMYYFMLLLVESAILGVFTSLNLILFYVFYELMLVPLYFMVGMWGGPRRIYATLKFFLYTMVGSMVMLVAILAVYFIVGMNSFDYVDIQRYLPAALGSMGEHGHVVEMLLFLGFFAAFAVKAPIFPFHSWVPDAYAEAPTGTTIILVALKMGLYGFIRFNLTLFPHATATAAPVIVTLAVIGVIYGALIAAVQTDLKRLIAYSSISHVGVIILAIFGLNKYGLTGSVLQMVAHTFTTGALFLLVGYLYARRGTYEISAYGGVWKVMPFFAAVFLVSTLSAIALPGTAGFSGEFLMLIGTFQSHPWATFFATTAAIWSTVYMLWMFKRVMHGKTGGAAVDSMTDLTVTEKFATAVLVAVILWIGVNPMVLMDRLNGSFSATQATTTASTVQSTAPTGTIIAILGRTWLPHGLGSRELDYLPVTTPTQSGADQLPVPEVSTAAVPVQRASAR